MTKKDAADPAEIIEEADRRREESTAHAEQTLTYFIEEVDGLLPRQTVIDRLQGYLDVDEVGARNALAQVVGDVVDPVQQVPTGDERYVGIIDLHEYEAKGAYGYAHYSDRFGRRNRVVCAQCVQEKELDENVAHATQGEGTSPEDADWQDLLDTVTGHYADAHDTAPESIDIGASLVSGTTMGGNQAWHDGNVSGGSNITIGSQSVSVDQGTGSGLNADQVDGDDASALGGGSAKLNDFTVGSGSSVDVSLSGYSTYRIVAAGVAPNDQAQLIGYLLDGSNADTGSEYRWGHSNTPEDSGSTSSNNDSKMSYIEFGKYTDGFYQQTFKIDVFRNHEANQHTSLLWTYNSMQNGNSNSGSPDVIGNGGCYYRQENARDGVRFEWDVTTDFYAGRFIVYGFN